MGTETHRETERFTGMGRRSSGAAQPTPGYPSRLEAKELTHGIPSCGSRGSTLTSALNIFTTPGPDAVQTSYYNKQ
jgi:hypothetical protein